MGPIAGFATPSSRKEGEGKRRTRTELKWEGEEERFNVAPERGHESDSSHSPAGRGRKRNSHQRFTTRK